MKKATFLIFVCLTALKLQSQVSENTADSLRIQLEKEKNKKSLLEIVIGFDSGYTLTTIKNLNKTGDYSSLIWTYGQLNHSGNYIREDIKIEGVWFCGNLGIRFPVYRIKGFELGVGVLGGFGAQRQTSNSIENSNGSYLYDEYLNSLYWDFRAEVFFNYYFNPVFRINLRAGVKYMKTQEAFLVPNLEFSLGFKYIEIGVSGNFLTHTYYREFTTGEREPAKIISYPVSGFVRGLIPISGKKKKISKSDESKLKK